MFWHLKKHGESQSWPCTVRDVSLPPEPSFNGFKRLWYSLLLCTRKPRVWFSAHKQIKLTEVSSILSNIKILEEHMQRNVKRSRLGTGSKPWHHIWPIVTVFSLPVPNLPFLYWEISLLFLHILYGPSFPLTYYLTLYTSCSWKEVSKYQVISQIK